MTPMSDYTIDTVKALRACHAALGQTKDKPTTDPDAERLRAFTNSALSATLVYLREPNPPVQKKHYDAVEALYTELGQGPKLQDQPGDAGGNNQAA